MKFLQTLLFVALGPATLPAFGQSCPSSYQLSGNDQCVGKPIYGDTCPPAYRQDSVTGACRGPVYDCPGQPGYSRIFAEGKEDETVCTKSKSVDSNPEGCPSGFFASAIARPPYNEICVLRETLPTRLSPSEERKSFAHLQMVESKQLNQASVLNVTTFGPGSTGLEFLLRDVGAKQVDDYFHGGMAYAQDLWHKGFRITVLTNGTDFYGAPLSPEGYSKVYGPFKSEPTSQQLTSASEYMGAGRSYKEYAIGGLYLGMGSSDPSLAKTGCTGLGQAVEDLLTSHKSRTCSIMSNDRRVIKIIWLSRIGVSETVAELRVKFGPPLPGLYKLLPSSPAETHLWKLKGGPSISVGPQEATNRSSGEVAYYTMVIESE